MGCWQCDLDITHVCYYGQRDARWGMNDQAVQALEAAQKLLNPPKPKRKRRKR